MPAIYRFSEPFVTESGFVLERPEVAYCTWGRLGPARDNAVVVCHALTGTPDAADWWGGLFGPGQPLDPGRHFIVCANVLGSCYGTTGPRSVDPATGRPYGGRFPLVTVRDTVRLHGRLLDALGVEGVALALGGSMGGMQALEWALTDGRVRAAVVVAVGYAHSAWQIGISEAQRQAIYADPKWRGGDYPPDDPPAAGLAAARAMAMMSYRSPSLFQDRFGRARQDGDPEAFAVESYLRYQGRKLVGRFDAASYVRLTQLMDRHDAAAGRGTPEAVLGALDVPLLAVGLSSDLLYPPAEPRALAALARRGAYAELETPFGHDAFLVAFAQLAEAMRPFLAEHGLLAEPPASAA
ncbi:MAG: homoserine O-acetyltransferase [Rubricoccaceae bacterium]